MALKIIYPPIVRVKRAAEAFHNGPAILGFIRENKAALIAAADQGVPPVSAISGGLKDRFPVDMKASPIRQFVGTAIKAVLTEAGFEVHQTGVRLPRDPVFTTGAIYRKASAKKNKESDAVREAFSAMVAGMPLAHKRIMLDVIQVALGTEP